MARWRVILTGLVLCAAPLRAQLPTPGLAGSPITNAGVARAAATVDSVFLERQIAVSQVDVGDFTGYLLARLGVPPFPDSMGFRVTSDSARIRIQGRLMDFPADSRAELGPIFSFVDSTSTFVAEISMPDREGGVMRFRLERLLVSGFPIPEFLFLPALAEYAKRYPVLAKGGRDFLVAMPPEAKVSMGMGVLELRMPK